MTGTSSGSPTVRRLLLGQRLRAYRLAAERSPDEVADHMCTTSRTVLRWEGGQANIRLRDLVSLFDLYAVPREDWSEMTSLAKEARRPGWWTPYNSDLKPTFKTFLGLEQGAVALKEYSAIVLPGLLQTEAYMRAVMESAIPMLDDRTIDARVEVRLKRQAEINSRAMPTHFVIDEACLMRRVGGIHTMNTQLQAVIEAARSRLVTVQILPLAIGSHASMLGAFNVLEFAEMGPVACVEMLGGDLYADGEDSMQYTSHFDKLREGALPEPHSLALVEKIRREFHHEP